MLYVTASLDAWEWVYKTIESSLEQMKCQIAREEARRDLDEATTPIFLFVFQFRIFAMC